jgi:hypothetical protein
MGPAVFLSFTANLLPAKSFLSLPLAMQSGIQITGRIECYEQQTGE